jgi:tetratricopeptide (TPR) repeat protein
VQVVTPKPRRPGFVALASLGQYGSDDPAVAWEYLGLGRLAASAGEAATRSFCETLSSFSSRFPGTPQARFAVLEQARIHLNLAARARAAGKDHAQWQDDLSRAKQALDSAAISETGPEEEKRLLTQFQDLSRETGPEATPRAGGPQSARSLAESVEIANLLERAQAAWRSGDPDSCEKYANRVLAIDPVNKTAIDWRWRVAKSREQ